MARVMELGLPPQTPLRRCARPTLRGRGALRAHAPSEGKRERSAAGSCRSSTAEAAAAARKVAAHAPRDDRGAARRDAHARVRRHDQRARARPREQTGRRAGKGFASGRDSHASNARIENHERRTASKPSNLADEGIPHRNPPVRSTKAPVQAPATTGIKTTSEKAAAVQCRAESGVRWAWRVGTHQIASLSMP